MVAAASSRRPPPGEALAHFDREWCPHYSGTTLDAQKRYADGTIEILNNWLNNKPQNPVNLIVENGEYATKAYGERKK